MNMEQEYPEENLHGQKRKTGIVAALLLAVSLVAGGVGAIFAIRIWGGAGQTAVGTLVGNRESVILETVPVDTNRLMTPAQVYAANVNSTVGITTSVTTNFWGFPSTSAASGSGFIISADGYILTNYHVVEGFDSTSVALFSGESYDAAMVGYDQSNDIAVLKIEAAGLPPVVLGDSEKMNVGDDVLAIGNPLGELTFSLTAGKISAQDREVTFSNSVMMDLLQTDCAINSGNSGGALFNLYGEVIGVTNAKYSGSSGSGATIDNIGFAIPINSVRVVMESIIEKGYVSKPYIGVTVTDVTQEHQLYGLPEGAVVRAIEKGSPAEASGLQPGDIITHADGKVISGSRELVRLLRNCTVGQKLKLTLYRKGQTLTVDVTAAEQKPQEQSQ
jgi:serine protease Do